MSELTTAKQNPEQWAPIPGYEGYYEASTHGRILSVRWGTPKLLKLSKHHLGYLRVNLGTPHIPRKQFFVRELIAKTFLGRRPDGHYIVHLDGVLHNCRKDNLAYKTPSESSFLKYQRNPVQACKRGHKFTENNARTDPKTGRRFCRACANARSHIRRHPEQKGQFQHISDGYYMRNEAAE